MTKTRQQSYKVFKGFSADVEYSSNMWMFQLVFILFTGVFLLWGATTFMNVELERPVCSKSL